MLPFYALFGLVISASNEVVVGSVLTTCFWGDRPNDVL